MGSISFLRPFLSRLWTWLRPLTHAGVPANVGRPEERELVTANIVVIFSILFTTPDVINYFSFDHPATTHAGYVALTAVVFYVIGFILLSVGHRFIGVFLFTHAVILNLAFLTVILGTLCGTQYYFVAVGIGGMFVWPSKHKRMRIPLVVLGAILFVVSVRVADTGPWTGAPLPADVVSSIFNRQSMGAYFIAFALAFYALAATEKAESALEKEHEKSEALLLNILPRVIADRLKQNDRSIADGFPEVTILFADVVGFTPMTQRLAPEKVVEFLNRLFVEFDLLAAHYGLEKIKTIGDAYMVAAGIPEPRHDHATAVAHMALRMLEVAQQFRMPGGESLQLRIGINTGPAVAGVIGIRKFSYDLWGDTVNTASRMESHGIPGTIQVTEETRRMLESEFVFEQRGIIDVKGKGPMPLHLLRSRRNGDSPPPIESEDST